MVYTEEELKNLREGGKRLSSILKKVAEKTVEGTRVFELNEYAEKLIYEGGDEPSFLNYQPEGAEYPYPSSLCVSVNDEIVHGISTGNERILKNGDIVGLDLGLKHKGLFTDTAITVPVGEIDDESQRLIEMTKKSLFAGIKVVKDGVTTGDIGFAIADSVRDSGFGVVDELGGHGVGHKVHEEPFVPNTGEKGEGEILREGMVVALEPMLNAGTKDIILDDDGYTFKTADGKRSAHFEHTILVTEKGAEILT